MLLYTVAHCQPEQMGRLFIIGVGLLNRLAPYYHTVRFPNISRELTGRQETRCWPN